MNAKRWRDIPFSELAHFTTKQQIATEAADARRYALFGGARGPGKSYWLRWYSLRQLLTWGGMGLTGVRTMLACEDYPSLRDRQLEKIQREFPPWVGDWRGSVSEYQLKPAYGGGVICLRNLDDASKYQSAEFALIAIDELTKNTEQTFNILRGSLRWPGIERTQFIAATNPSGPGAVGAEWVRACWVEHKLPEHLQAMADEFVFVPALPRDNPHLPDSYLDELNALPEYYRRAWRDGDWYVTFEGLVYEEFRRAVHVQHRDGPWRRFIAGVDEGYTNPAVILVIGLDGDDRAHVVEEFYQRRVLQGEVVATAKQLHGQYGIETFYPDPSAAGLIADMQEAGLPVIAANNAVNDGIQAVKARWAIAGDGRPCLTVEPTCTSTIAEAESYIWKPGRDEPVKLNDHAMDTLRYALLTDSQPVVQLPAAGIYLYEDRVGISVI